MTPPPTTGHPLKDALIRGVCTCDSCRRFDALNWAREFEREVRPVEALWRPGDEAVRS